MDISLGFPVPAVPTYSFIVFPKDPIFELVVWSVSPNSGGGSVTPSNRIQVTIPGPGGARDGSVLTVESGNTRDLGTGV
jgi:hypothetical protein